MVRITIPIKFWFPPEVVLLEMKNKKNDIVLKKNSIFSKQFFLNIFNIYITTHSDV